MRLRTALVAAGAAVAVGAVALRRGPAVPWSMPGGRVQEAALSVRTVGAGEPSWLLLHGMFRSGRYWSAEYDGLPGTVAAPDLLGFGRSRAAAPAHPSAVTAEAHADAVASSVEQLGIATPVVVVGHSTGALVALHVARRHPELVRGIVAINPPLYPDAGAARRRFTGADGYTRLFLAHPALSEATCELMCRHRDGARLLTRLGNPGMPAPLNDDAVEHTWASFRGTLDHLLLSDAHERWTADVTAPLHVIVAAGDGLMDLGHLRRLTDRSGAELTVVPGEHDLPLRDPARCVALIRAAAAAFG